MQIFCCGGTAGKFRLAAYAVTFSGMHFNHHFQSLDCSCSNRTGRWEAHIWEEGKQVYLGGFDNEEEAALAHDIAAVRFRAHDANTNFNISNYKQELKHLPEVLVRSKLEEQSMLSYPLHQHSWC